MTGEPERQPWQKYQSTEYNLEDVSDGTSVPIFDQNFSSIKQEENKMSRFVNLRPEGDAYAGKEAAESILFSKKNILLLSILSLLLIGLGVGIGVGIVTLFVHPTPDPPVDPNSHTEEEIERALGIWFSL